MPEIHFLKVHGAGNDFVLLPDLDDRLDVTPGLVRMLCDRHRGIGGDGLIRLGGPRQGADAHVVMDYRNADGGIAEMCGNGVRTVAKYAADRGIGDGDPVQTVRVDTRAGVKEVRVHRGGDGLVETCTVDMGAPLPGVVDKAIDLDDGSQVVVTTVSMGNPHAVILVEDVATAPVTTVGPQVERHPAFPDGTNVEFIAVVDRRTVHGRIWERGVGETLASGTGGSAMAVAAALHDLADRDVDVHLPGGVLHIAWGQHSLHVTGPAVEVGGGVLDRAWLAAAGIGA